MSDQKFTWCPATDAEEWNRLVALSPQGTLFSEHLYLSAIPRSVDRFIIRKGLEPKALVCVARNDAGDGCALDDLLIYGGVMFVPQTARPAVKRRFEEFALTEFAIGRLDEQYGAIEMALSPAFADARPFLWHHYHQPASPRRYTLELRYTSFLDISSLRGAADPEQTPCFLGMETVRRYSVREARRKGGSARKTNSSERLLAYYEALMASQGEPPDAAKIAAMREIVAALVAAGRGAVYEAFDAQGVCLYAAAYGWDAQRAYYLFGSGHPDISEPWQGTLVHWEAFKDLAAHSGVGDVDLEGVNSPQRGWFKLGFGGDLRPYFHARNQTRGEPVGS